MNMDEFLRKYKDKNNDEDEPKFENKLIYKNININSWLFFMEGNNE